MHFKVLEGVLVGARLERLRKLMEMRRETLETRWRRLSVQMEPLNEVETPSIFRLQILSAAVSLVIPPSRSFPVFTVVFLLVYFSSQRFIGGGEDVTARWPDHKLQ